MLLNPILSDDKKLQPITDLNMPLNGTSERILHNLLRDISRQRLRRLLHQCQPLPRTRNILILQIDLIIQERHDETRRRASSTTLFPFVTPHGVIGVQRPLAVLIYSAKDSSDVEGEEPLAVEDMAQPLRAGGNAHFFPVLVAVHLHRGVETFFQGVAIGREAYHRQHDAAAFVLWSFAADLEEFGDITRVDVVAACGTGVACEDGEVGAGDA